MRVTTRRGEIHTRLAAPRSTPLRSTTHARQATVYHMPPQDSLRFDRLPTGPHVDGRCRPRVVEMHRRMQRHRATSYCATLLGLTSFTRPCDVRAGCCCNSRRRRRRADRYRSGRLLASTSSRSALRGRTTGQRTTLANAYASDGVAV